MKVSQGNKNGRRQIQKLKPKPKLTRKQQRQAILVGMSFERSVENLSVAGRETLGKVNGKKRGKLLNNRPNSSSIVFDRNCPFYRWLHSGWLVEERRMLHSGRLYRYYYDLAGKSYSKKHEVMTIFQGIENNRVLIVLDD